MDQSRTQKMRDLCDELTFTEFLESMVYLAMYEHENRNQHPNISPTSGPEDFELDDPIASALVHVLRSLFSIGRKSRAPVWLDFFDSDTVRVESVNLES
jgi:hypothetical protein